MDNIIFSGFKRVNEAVNTEKLQPDELALLQNMRLDEEYGCPTTRKGYSKFNTNQAATSESIKAIFDIVDKDGNNAVYIATDTKIRQSANGSGTWSDLKTGLTNTYRPRLASYGGKFYLTNGMDKPFYTDGTDVSNMEIERPDVSSVGITLGGVVSPKLSEGIYRYVIIYLTIDGQRSNASVAIQPFYQASGYDSITLTSIPVSADTRVLSKLIFRTKVNILSTYYLVATIDNDTTSYEDTTTDNGLNTAETFEYLNTPNYAKYNCIHQDRLFLANFNKTYTNRVIPPPHIDDDSSFIASESAGILLAGTYKYAASYVDIEGNESDLVPFLTYVVSTDNKQISFKVIQQPIAQIVSGVATAYPNIKTIRFYRTKKDGSIYYFLLDFISIIVPPTYVLITDNAADASLTVLYPVVNTDPYPNPFSNPQKAAAGTVDLSSSIVFSNISKPLEIPELNYIEIYPDDKDAITGIYDDDNGVLIFKERSICKLYTNGNPENWSIVKLVDNIGCSQPDTICRYENTYFSVFQGLPYLFSGNTAKPIGESFKTSFGLVTTFGQSTYSPLFQWFVLTVKVSSVYYLFIYDLKLQGWYKWTINKADSILLKEAGTYGVGKLVFGGNEYLSYYNELATSDTDSGSTVEITATFRTKTFIIDDFAYMRLMHLFINYQRLTGTTNNSITFTLADPVTGDAKYLADTTEENERIYKKATDAMTSNLQRCEKIYFNVSGIAIRKFIMAKLEFEVENYGVNITG